MVKRQQILSNELNKTYESGTRVEHFHAAECYSLLGEGAILSEEKVKRLLQDGVISERRNRVQEALHKIIYAKIAAREGNYAFAVELYEQVLEKINVLNRGAQQENTLTYFYFEYSNFLHDSGDKGAALMYLEKASNIARANRMKQIISYQFMVRKSGKLKKSILRKWLQSIAYFNKYSMTTMETQAFYDLALYYIDQSELGDAASYLDKAHELAVTSGYQYLLRKIDFARGCLLVKQDRDAEALHFFESLLGEIKNNYFQSRLWNKVAELYQKLQNPDKALDAAMRSMEISQRYSIGSELGESSVRAGEIYHRTKANITKAFFYYQQGYGAVMELAQRGIPIIGERQGVINNYISFLEEHFPGDMAESANEDLFAFSQAQNWVRIKDLFHYNLFLYHYMNTGVGSKTLEALDFPASSFYSATERLRSRGITFPNFRRNDVVIPSENYVEGLQQYARMHRDKSWVDINEQFEKDMLAYHYKLNTYNKKLLAKNLELAYSGIVNRTKYLTS